MADHIVPGQGLLDHQQAELIERQNAIDIMQRVGIVGIGHQRGLRAEGFPYRAHEFHIHAGLDFDFDFAVALCQLGCCAFHQRLRTFLNAKRNTGGDLAACAADQSGQWQIMYVSGHFPARHFNCGFGHQMAADVIVKQRQHLVGLADVGAQHLRRYPFGNRQPAGVDGFGAVVRILAGDALAPAGVAITVLQFDQENATVVHRAGRNLKRFAQG